ERVLALELVQYAPGIGDPGHRGAERPAEPVKHGAREQEVSQWGRLPVEHLKAQVIDDLLVVAGERFDELAGIVAALERQPRELQTRRPALRALMEAHDLSMIKVYADRPGEKGAGLSDAEPQVGGAYLGQLPSGSQAAERQRWVGPRGDHDVSGGG